jgi:hypothetical protein
MYTARIILSNRFAVAALCTTTTVSGSAAAYHPSKIGKPGKPWGVDEYTLWRDTRQKQRCYLTDVVPHVHALQSDVFEVVQYGALQHEGDGAEPAEFPLFAVRSRNWSKDKPNVFITGGIHGYEVSAFTDFGT